MKVIGRATFGVVVVADLADYVTGMNMLAAENSVGVELMRIQMHVSNAHMGVPRIDEQIDGFLFGRAQDNAIVGGDDDVLIWKAAIGTVVEQRAGAWSDILALMSFPAWTLPDKKVAVLAKIVAPGI